MNATKAENSQLLFWGLCCFLFECDFYIFSGPHYWGKINTKWILCSKGKNQSPINIEPKDLLFDPGLKHIKLTGKQVNK